MTNKDTHELGQIISGINDKDLRGAITSLRSFITSHPGMKHGGELDETEEDFNRMLQYMSRGYIDPAREEQYTALLKRLYSTAADTRLECKLAAYPMQAEAARHAAQHTLTHDSIRHELEDFTAGEAMLGLEQGDDKDKKEEELYERHHRFMSLVFDSILTARQWKTSDAEFFESLLLSPTIEADDALLIVSAITLACMNEFDINKLTALMNVYEKTSCEPLRQRSLVGWVFSLSDEASIYDEQTRLVEEACATGDTAKELADMQKQVAFCVQADKDNETIQRDIMPTLMKNNNLKMTKDGITEKEDDPMDDILGRGNDDKRMEEIEDSIQKVMSMQQSGSDIYFGGFSQMKRFSFFYTLCNWFTPFSLKHPGLRSAVGKTGGKELLESLLESGPFCDSDKYSLVLAMSAVLEKMPAQMREALGSPNAIPPYGRDTATDNPAYIRRMYLQDLYRFFRLYPQPSGIDSPFDDTRYVFAAARFFDGTALRKMSPQIGLFFHSHNQGKAVGIMAAKCGDCGDTCAMLLNGLYKAHYQHDYAAAIPFYERALELAPDNEGGMWSLARSYMQTGQHAKAAPLYDRLRKMKPEKSKYALYYCAAQIECWNLDEASKTLYQLNFEMPDNPEVTRLLAWMLMGQGKPEEADKEYARLLKLPQYAGNDSLNAGYCKWFLSDIGKAVEHFRSFKEHCHKTTLMDDFRNDKTMLMRYDKNETDWILMDCLV